MVLLSDASVFNNVWRPFFTGRNPSKQKRSHGSPDETIAGMHAVDPGSVCISIPSDAQVRTRRNPGSEMPGVPASLIRATFKPPTVVTNALKSISGVIQNNPLRDMVANLASQVTNLDIRASAAEARASIAEAKAERAERLKAWLVEQRDKALLPTTKAIYQEIIDMLDEDD